MDKFLDKLYQTYEQEIRGSNKPIEDVDRRPNYIGMCINMFETNEQKIQCLRQVKEQTAMNPFYQHRIDRFIDAITNTWEPTDKPGFVEYIRGERDSALVESLEIPDYLDFLEQDAGPPPKAVQLKASGAEQDDEEPPTDERTKKFEKDEAKVSSKNIDEYIQYVFEQDRCVPECENKIQTGKDPIWISGIRAVSIGRKLYSLCLLKCRNRAKNLPRSELLKATKKERQLEAKIKILLVKIDQKDPQKAARIKQYTNKIVREIKVGTEQIRQDLNDVLSEDPLTLGTLLATTPIQKAAIGAAAAGGAYLMGKKVKQDLQKRCHVKHEGYPERIKRCLATGH
jgi:hypothetical protein